MFDVSADFSKNCGPNFTQNTGILITLENTSAEKKGLECTIAYNNIESRFPFLYQLWFYTSPYRALFIGDVITYLFVLKI